MQLDTIFGLPIHALVVHAVVVLLPLACIGSIAIAARFSWRERYGGLVLIVAVIATLSVPVATQSGEAFAQRVGNPADHAENGEAVKYYVIPWVLLLIAMLWWSRKAVATREFPTEKWFIALRIAVVLMSLATIVGVAITGHSGAEAAWSKIVANTTPGTSG